MRKAAFTLIELLVVIAIIAILAGLTIPVVVTALEKGKSAKDLNNLHQLGAGLSQYLIQNENTMLTTAPSNGGVTWPQTLYRYVTDWRTFESPFDSRSYASVAPFPVSYGFNPTLFGTSTAQYNYPTQLIVMAGAYSAGTMFSGLSTDDVVLRVPLANVRPGVSGGTFHSGEQLNVLYADFHVGTVLVSTYNDVSDALGIQQWQYNAPPP